MVGKTITLSATSAVIDSHIYTLYTFSYIYTRVYSEPPLDFYQQLRRQSSILVPSLPSDDAFGRLVTDRSVAHAGRAVFEYTGICRRHHTA